jgi:hypothetical protein
MFLMMNLAWWCDVPQANETAAGAERQVHWQVGRTKTSD